MQSNKFGNSRVSPQQSRIDAATFHQASVMTGANPVTPSRGSYNSTDRQASPSSIPSRTSGSQHFFSSSNARQGTTSAQAGASASAFNHGAGPSGSSNSSSLSGQMSRPAPSTQQSQAIQSSRPGWHTFTPPSGQTMQSNGSRTTQVQNGIPSRPNFPQSSAPPQYQNNSRGGYNGNTSNRPSLNMQQPVVTPRNNGSYSGRPMPSAPGRGSYGPPQRGPSNAGSYSGRPAPSAPSGGSHGGSYGGSSGGGSRGGGATAVAQAAVRVAAHPAAGIHRPEMVATTN